MRYVRYMIQDIAILMVFITGLICFFTGPGVVMSLFGLDLGVDEIPGSHYVVALLALGIPALLLGSWGYSIHRRVQEDLVWDTRKENSR
jgi:hypothetical protein